ncbi:MAG: hypothetical protein WC819_02485 [Parcubacteria group bacterium]|jgi:hypothetical protein
MESTDERNLVEQEKVAVDGDGCTIFGGFVTQIVLKNGKYMYTGVGSINENTARAAGFDCKIVEFSGHCHGRHINEQAHQGCMICIEGVSVAEFIDKIATVQECIGAFPWKIISDEDL